MTNPRQPSLLQARDLHPHSDSHSHPHPHPQTHTHTRHQAHRHDFHLEQSQQHHSPEDTPSPGPRRQGSDLDNIISAVHDDALPQGVADAHPVANEPLATEAVQAIAFAQPVTPTRSPLVGASASLPLPPPPSPPPPLPLPGLLLLLNLLPTDASSSRLAETDANLFPITSSTTTADLGTSSGVTSQRPLSPTSVFVNASVTGATNSSVSSFRAIPTPSIPSTSRHLLFFTDGRNSSRTSSGSSSDTLINSGPFPHHNGTTFQFLVASNNNSSTTRTGTGTGTGKGQPTTTAATKSTSASLEPTNSSSKHIFLLSTSTSTSTIFSSDVSSSTPVFVPTTTVVAPLDGGAGVGSAAAGSDPQASTIAPSNSSPGSLTPQQKQVIGGVIGGVAGCAFFAVFILVLLRYRRNRDRRDLLDAAQGPAFSNLLSHHRGGFDGPGLAGQSGAGESMAERNDPAAALTGGLAAMVGKPKAVRSGSSGSNESGERSFYRVSGRKLPSVLEAGGDGYTDPRESPINNNLDSYRGLETSPTNGLSTRFALGNPMRPVSGVPIMRSGPARIPITITTEDPFADRPTTSMSESRSPFSVATLRDSPLGSKFHESL